MKLLVALISVALFSSGAVICTYFYNPCTHINEWWDLRMNLYSILILMCFLFSTMEDKKWQYRHIKFVLGVGVGFSIADVIDRLIFNINTFTAADSIMITATIILSYVEAYTNISSKFKSYIQKLCHRSRK